MDRLQALSRDEITAQAAALRPNLEQSCQIMTNLLQTRRHYVRKTSDPDSSLGAYDPRYLIFEFCWNIVLRQKQVWTSLCWCSLHLFDLPLTP